LVIGFGKMMLKMMNDTPTLTLPLEGGGQGGGEYVNNLMLWLVITPN
jgi:hypothetical protein